MNKNACLSCVVLAAAYLPSSVGADEPRRHGDGGTACTREMSEATEIALSAFGRRIVNGNRSREVNSWPDFERLVAEHGACDDGVHGEMFSEMTAKMPEALAELRRVSKPPDAGD
jgi:hypothetical protein